MNLCNFDVRWEVFALLWETLACESMHEGCLTIQYTLFSKSQLVAQKISNQSPPSRHLTRQLTLLPHRLSLYKRRHCAAVQRKFDRPDFPESVQTK